MKKASVLILTFLAMLQQISGQMKNQTFTVEGRKVNVYTTAENTDLKISLTNNLNFQKAQQPIESEIFLFVNANKTFQTFTGMGGAITDASAEVFAKLSKEKQKELIEAYYSKEKGIAYNFIRTNISSCDFSSGSYNYIAEGDKELKTFSIDHDKQFKIPMIKEAFKTAGNNVLLFASPWSPPAFMKSNNNVLQGGKLLPEYHQAWANYYVKFIKSYEKEGLPVWGISIQNEPMATQRWESCIYTAEEERDFLKNFLGPTMHKEGLSSKKIIVWDHNRDLLSHRASVIFDDPEAAKYAWGIGFHWYETWSGGKQMFDNVRNVYESYPDKNLMFTEGCVEKYDSSRLQFWGNAERYGANLINDFNNGMTAYTDWNILLDEKGGPNHVGNFCFAPIHADTRTGQLIYTPSFYYIGHISKFVKPNAKRVSTTSSRSNLISTSFLNEDGSIATIVMNSTDAEIKYKLYVGASMTELTIKPHAIQTLVY